VSGGSAQVAVLGMRGRLIPERRPGAWGTRPHWIRVTTFGVLALYGAARWSTLLTGGTRGHLVGIVGLALLLVAVRPLIAQRSRLLAGVITALAIIAVFPVAGIPLHWILHLRIAVIANAIGEGLSALPQTLVPYPGLDPWVRLDIVLGGAVLIFDAALLLAFAPPGNLKDLRRAAAALPLIALVAVPSTLIHPRYPYLDGLFLFLLLAAFVLADRVVSARASSAVGLCLLAAVGGMLVAPSLDRHKAWFDYWTLAGRFAPKTMDTFNWSQTYGPLDWPRRGTTVLAVRARQPEYWKAEDLDVFDGQAWTQGVVPGQESTPLPDPRWVARWSETIQVTLRDMRTSDVIGAGLSARPQDVAEPVVPGFSSGTWTAGATLQSGDSYSVRVYTPQPSVAQLENAGTDYAGVPQGYRTILLPAREGPSGNNAAAQMVFSPFHSGQPPQDVIGLPLGSINGPEAVESSPYGGAYRLAQRLARGASTPYGFVEAVERYLAHGYTYDEDTPARAYPLESFLFVDKRGYCQQFAGAMALLLRMGGVPARVAVGFTQGRQDPSTGDWLVSDLDAHAWVEAWFPHFGWVRFDPTPAADPALAGIASTGTGTSGGTASTSTSALHHPNRGAAPGSRALPGGQGAHGSNLGPAEIAGGTVALLLLIALVLTATRPLASADALVDELERGLARSGRPVPVPGTLAELEHRLHGSPGARDYVRVLRLARFAGGEALPTPAQRRALRRELTFGLGPLGRLWGLWALPPRRRHGPRINQ
jgi:protein-glutamine gamma-glutamyltransferase